MFPKFSEAGGSKIQSHGRIGDLEIKRHKITKHSNFDPSAWSRDATWCDFNDAKMIAKGPRVKRLKHTTPIEIEGL